MNDSYDIANALKNVDQIMPEAGKLIRNYIDTLKSRPPQTVDEKSEHEPSCIRTITLKYDVIKDTLDPDFGGLSTFEAFGLLEAAKSMVSADWLKDWK